MSKPKILIVDDNNHFLEFDKEGLEELGNLEVYTARTRTERKTRLSERSYDAYILDATMAGDDVDLASWGKYDREAIEGIKLQNPFAPIIMITCHYDMRPFKEILPLYDQVIFRPGTDSEDLERIIFGAIEKKKNSPHTQIQKTDYPSGGFGYDPNFGKRSGD
ncbi:response regulator [Candidatus Pacearchaeota archaeon]|nr:response regulator [Candidatus Pacearchaeota archaeon]